MSLRCLSKFSRRVRHSPFTRRLTSSGQGLAARLQGTVLRAQPRLMRGTCCTDTMAGPGGERLCLAMVGRGSPLSQLPPPPALVFRWPN